MDQTTQKNIDELEKPQKMSWPIRQHHERLKDVHGVPHVISDVQRRHVPDIVEMFDEEYVKYYGKYVDERAFSEFLNDTEEAIQSEDQNPEEIVRVIERPDGQMLGVGALKLQGNMAELGSEIIHQDFRGADAARQEGNLYNTLFDDLMEVSKSVMDGKTGDPETRVDTEDYEGVDILYTQLLADVSAASQHVADENRFATTGIYDSKFPVAYEGKGRVTVVDMLWADSNIENSHERVYVPENALDIVGETTGNINRKRKQGEDITRRAESPESADYEGFEVKSKVVGEPMKFAEVEIKETDNGDYEWEEVVSEIEDARLQLDNGEGDYWVGVSLDANSEYCAEAARMLESLGFEYAGFNPGKIDADTNRDSLEMQLRHGEEKNKHFVSEAADYIQTLDIDDEVRPDKGHRNEMVITL